MTKSNYICQTCGYESVSPGMCPDCSMELEEVCNDCGNPKSGCVCENNKEEEEEK